jgi:hypothetical protein
MIEEEIECLYPGISSPKRYASACWSRRRPDSNPGKVDLAPLRVEGFARRAADGQALTAVSVVAHELMDDITDIAQAQEEKTTGNPQRASGSTSGLGLSIEK